MHYFTVTSYVITKLLASTTSEDKSATANIVLSYKLKIR